MYSESRFSELSQSLASGFFADKVVLALAHVQKKGQVRDKDRAIFNRVVLFLNEVLQGHDWIDKPAAAIDETSVRSAIAFSEAVRAKPDMKTSEKFTKYISSLLDTAKHLLERRRPHLEEVKDLRDFFSSYGRSELIRSENLIEDNGGEIIT